MTPAVPPGGVNDALLAELATHQPADEAEQLPSGPFTKP